VRLAKNGAAWAQKNDATAATHEEAGWYEVDLDATDTNTLGVLMLAVHEAGALPVWVEFTVVSAAIYDWLIGADVLSVDVAAVAPAAIDSNAFTAALFNAIADALLGRSVATVEGTAPEHSLATLILAGLEFSITGTTLTIKRSDGVTTHATKALTASASADPITGIS
jgi:hypothetical protein